MMQKIQRFGAAMFVPVLFFAFYGIVVGFSVLIYKPRYYGVHSNGRDVME